MPTDKLFKKLKIQSDENRILSNRYIVRQDFPVQNEQYKEMLKMASTQIKAKYGNKCSQVLFFLEEPIQHALIRHTNKTNKIRHFILDCNFAMHEISKDEAYKLLAGYACMTQYKENDKNDAYIKCENELFDFMVSII